MGKQLYKVGDMVYYSGNLSMGDEYQGSGYGVIVDIIFNNLSFREMEIITGNGDKNTKAKIKVKIISESVHDTWSTSEKINLISKEIFTMADPHHIHLRTLKNFEKRYKKDLDTMNKNLEIFKKFGSTRDEKIEKILND